MARKLIVGNWKMNGSLAMNAELLEGIKAGLAGVDCDLAVCVPFPYLAQCQHALEGTGIALGAEDVSAHAVGAYTGQVSTRMLLDFDCKYAIVGHSERREYCNESDELVANKVQRALAGGLTPIVCVGESLKEKDAGLTEAVVSRQINTVLSVLEEREVCDIVVAYEPVWAIGTGKTPTPEMVKDVHALMRELMIRKNPDAAERVRILYGGSMKPSNAEEFLKMRDIDGGLIGGAALKASDFLKIAYLASK
ncbi:triose-phosphate isomerase [Oxalobacter sp. OxGP1]|uniref:triose-phosphate isomerase n=1 Tax=Oxalobacter paeniformigenes TaxID=2946594 RepID=UPI0022AE93FC|nr:triose-phosphate isomerase [Oxalobacter paeniformigenes]MCZ4052242.1 triose-phosphate isomerase [Oxalobacter paeniformigenes]